MTKNIIVVDEQGRKYGATYPKRAKGLVKQGRARFLAHNMLCLACPPNKDLEDNDMSEQTIENTVTEENTVTGIENNAAEITASEDKYSIGYCIEQIESIGKQTEYLNQAISEMRQLDNDSASEQKAMALGQMVSSRETTNQQLLRFYEKMYDDLKKPASVNVVSEKVRLQEQLLKVMEKTLENSDFSEDKVTDMFNGAFDAIRHIND